MLLEEIERVWASKALTATQKKTTIYMLIAAKSGKADGSQYDSSECIGPNGQDIVLLAEQTRIFVT